MELKGPNFFLFLSFVSLSIYLSFLFLLRRLGALLEDVALQEEVEEERKERDDVVQVGLCYPRREGLAASDEQEAGLQVHQDELNHLTDGQSRLPPNLLRVQRHEIVRVHDGVDEAVENNGEIDISVVTHRHVEPVKEKDGKVVVNVQKGQLRPPLFGNNKEGVCKVENLGQVEDVQNKPHRRILVVKGLAWQQRVARLECLHARLDAHVRTQHYLDNIVQELKRKQALHLERHAAHQKLFKGRGEG